MTPEDDIEEFKHEHDVTKKYWKGWLSIFGRILIVLIPLQLLVLIVWNILRD